MFPILCFQLSIRFVPDIKHPHLRQIVNHNDLSAGKVEYLRLYKFPQFGEEDLDMCLDYAKRDFAHKVSGGDTKYIHQVQFSYKPFNLNEIMEVLEC